MAADHTLTDAAPTLTQVIETVCERVCMSCDNARHSPRAHQDDIAPVIDELIDQGWLVISGPGEWS